MGAQLALCLALALVLTYHERVYRQANLKYWRASFVALAVSAAFALLNYFYPRTPTGELLRFGGRAISLVALALHVAWLVAGAHAWQYRRELPQRTVRAMLLVASLVALGVAIAGAYGEPMQGARVRSYVTTLLVPLVYLLVAAWTLASQ